ncbi:MAG: hypothetical protein GY884_13685 [Proteobacteria bacterium]|nr:hypothetical protein [Pseudomonadota bacterium]
MTVTGNTATGASAEGAGVHVTGGSLTVIGSLITDNANTVDESGSVYSYGAGLYAWGTVLDLTDSTITRNRIDATGTSYVYIGGAGLFVTDSPLTMTRVVFEENVVETTTPSFTYVEGSAVYMSAWDEPITASLTDVEILDNDATATSTGSFSYVYGSAAALYGAYTLDIDGVSSHGNAGTATGDSASNVYGGGFYAFEAALTGHGLDIRDNTLFGDDSGYGAGFSAEWAQVDLTNVVVAGNELDVDGDAHGGAIQMLWDDYGWYERDEDGDVQLTNADISGNSASGATVQGAALYLGDAALLALRNANIAGNRSTPDADGAVGFLGNAASADLAYVNAWDHDGDDDWTNDEGAVSFDGLMSFDPTCTDTSAANATDWDLRPGEGSSAIDAGDPELFDADGSTSDLGAYGGPLGE